MTRVTILGGLTIDRFPDGRLTPGGSVLHSGLSAVAEGARLTTVTVSGAEPAAREGLERLGGLGGVVHQRSSASTTYRHEQVDGRRQLVLEAASEPIQAEMVDRAGRTDVALVAPIAHEVPASTLDHVRRVLRPRLAVLLIQGWLRQLRLGEPVHPLPLAGVPESLWRAFGTADAVVVSTEDLTEAPGDPFAQSADLRARLGPRPLLVVTLGTEGYLLDDPAADRLVASVPRRVVEGVPAVGAGDTFGASLAINLARGLPPKAAADAATERVIAVLEARRS